MNCKLIKNIHKEIVEQFNYVDMYDVSNLDFNYDINKLVREVNGIHYQIVIDDIYLNKYKQIE